MEEVQDVMIVGAGPVGLVLALILAEHGISFRIIDKREHWSEESKALSITPKTLEALSLIGLADEFIKAGIASEYIHFFNHKSKPISSIRFRGLASPCPFILQLPQSTSTRILVNALAEKGIHIERPLSLAGVEKKAKGYSRCHLTHKETKEDVFVNARYVIGCDGAGSRVREIMGEQFDDAANEKEAFMMADIKLANHRFQRERYMYYLKGKSSLYVMPMNHDYYRLISTTDRSLSEIDQAYVLERFAEIFRQLGLSGISLSAPLWISTFNPRQHVAKNYIKDNLILAGDAAHIQSPVGSQGLNTGIQDAVNLGWKLAFVLKSLSHKDLLNTYHEERRPLALKLFAYNNQLNNSVFGQRQMARKLAISKRYLLNFNYYHNKERDQIAQMNIGYPDCIPFKKLPVSNLVHPRLAAAGLKAGARFPYFKLSKDGIEQGSYDLLNIKKYTLFVIMRDASALKPELLNYDPETTNTIVLEYASDSKKNKQNAYTLKDKCISINKDYVCLVRPDSYIENVALLTSLSFTS